MGFPSQRCKRHNITRNAGRSQFDRTQHRGRHTAESRRQVQPSRHQPHLKYHGNQQQLDDVANLGLRPLPVAGIPFRVCQIPSKSDPWDTCRHSGLSFAPTWMAVRCWRPGEARPGLHRTWVRCLGWSRHSSRNRGSSVLVVTALSVSSGLPTPLTLVPPPPSAEPESAGSYRSRSPRLSPWTSSGTCPSCRRYDAGDSRSDSSQNFVAAQQLSIVSGGHLGFRPHGPPTSRWYPGASLPFCFPVNYPSRPSGGRSGGQSDGWVSRGGENGLLDVIN